MAHAERRDRKAADGTMMRAYRVRWREPDAGKIPFETYGHADPGFTLRTCTHLMEGSSTLVRLLTHTVRPTR
ncbi:hypothetical protein [Tomitella gaofuii]|uniref:hypothetical protein n=1 Tax=Tomitella gaofuii TaxID=2760083 RepID=UPI0020BDDE45|nr:hypothetical protein [Tomitella gaofuii]